MKVRLPCVSGQFYEGEGKKLTAQVSSCLPQKSTRRPAKAVMVPHAGLMYSGGVAGEVYASLEWTGTVVLLGPNHTGYGKPLSLSDAEYWSTPLGEVGVNQKLSRLLLRHIPGLERDDEAHRYEHSLEVQLPFLQSLSGKTEIVPVCLGFGSAEGYQAFGLHLAEALAAFGEEVVVIASSDMTHYEPHEQAKAKDAHAIRAILAVDPDKLTSSVREHRISMCGYAPVVSMLSYAKKRGLPKGELVRYQTSGDVSGDYASVVGYAGVSFPS